MKIFSKALAALLLFTAITTNASVNTVSCYSSRSGDDIEIYIANQELKAIRVLNNGLPQQFLTSKIQNQNLPNQTAYTVAFTNSIVLVDNALLQTNVGNLTIDGETFICGR